MRKKFNTFEYIKDLGEDLIRDFDKAGKNTHPHSVGEGREKSSMEKLKDILPEGIGIGSGFVIDSYGNVSSQCDLIIYEKNLCLKFNNIDKKNRYYNCESVIAVGEVKSGLTRKELKDSLNKMKKIKNLKRYIKDDNSFRRYLSTQGIAGTDEEKLSNESKSLDQIFAFLLCNKFELSEKNIVDEIKTSNYKKYEYVNCIISVDGYYLGFAKKIESSNFEIRIGALDSDAIIVNKSNNSFGRLLQFIFHSINNGRTSTYNPTIYIYDNENFNSTVYPFL